MPAEIHEITGWMFGLLTHELGDPQSPVRRFFATRFTQGAGAVQEPVQGWCRAPPATMRPWAPRPGWLLRYLVHPAADYWLAWTGAGFARSRGVEVLAALGALSELTTGEMAGNPARFDGPGQFAPCPDLDLIARTCWALALLTAVWVNSITTGASGLGRPGTRRFCRVPQRT